MKLHNTLTKEIEELTPLKQGEWRVYSCGPTVYNRVHIGNLSSFIMADVLHRTLQATGNSVKHVMNFTDVDDKTIAASQAEHPDLDAKEALAKLTGHYGDLFLQDMAKVGNDVEQISFVKATDSIADMQTLITKLYEAGVAYIAEDGVYFNIKAYRDQGKTYGQLLSITASSTSQARVQNDEYDKESAHDFALWKVQKSSEPAWDYELDGRNLAGRPGWHIECSAMSSKSLGQPFDIHTGGIDLIFPHHENEIAQSTALGSNYAQAFMHNEHLLIDGRKMSKSLNNFYTLTDLEEKGIDPLAFRMLVLQGHYRNQINFTWDSLEAAANRLHDLQKLSVLRYQPISTAQSEYDLSAALSSMQDMLTNDLRTPEALAELSSVSTQTQSQLVSQSNLPELETFLQKLDDLFGFNLLGQPDITQEQKALIAERDIARKAEEWAKCDAIRNELKEQGINLNDTKYGAVWYR